MTIIFPADKLVFAFFGALSSVVVHCFDCCFNSGVEWWIQVSSTVTNRRQKCFVLRLNIAKQCIDVSLATRFGRQWVVLAPIVYTAFACPILRAGGCKHVQSKCVKLQRSYALFLDGLPKWCRKLVLKVSFVVTSSGHPERTWLSVDVRPRWNSLFQK